jgi:Flp pilus assembly protein TadD
VLRKAFAAIHAERRQHANALRQLLAARALQPDDAEVHAALVAACDQLGKPREACAALLAAIANTPTELDLSLELGRRLQQLGDAEGAERAVTNVVEVQPEEADSHRRVRVDGREELSEQRCPGDAEPAGQDQRSTRGR